MEKQDPTRRAERLLASYRTATGGLNDRYVQAALYRLAEAGGVQPEAPTGTVDATGLAAGELARMIDHTALKPETTTADVRGLCEEARRYGFASVCVNPGYVALAAEQLAETPVAVCTVVGFPLGATLARVKAYETEAALAAGATEIDMVLHVGRLKSGDYAAVADDIRGVTEAVRAEGALSKVILETALLTDEEKAVACILAFDAGADFVKTSTGFARGGATTADVALMRRLVGNRMGVKASGGVRTREEAEAMIAHGATRLGASASVAILEGFTSAADY